MPHVEGFLLSQSPEGLRLLLGHSAVVVSDSNVESVEILDAVRLPNELKAVRVHYRDELPAPNRDALTGRGRPSGGLLPFAMACRQQPAQVSDSPRYRAMETQFLEERGLLVPPAAGTQGWP